MKTLVLATVASFSLAGAASAVELGNTGVTAGAAVDAYYDFDTEGFNTVLTPALGYNIAGLGLSASTDITFVDNGDFAAGDAFDALEIDLGATYNVWGNANLYGETTFGVTDKAFSGAKVGVAFSF